VVSVTLNAQVAVGDHSPVTVIIVQQTQPASMAPALVMLDGTILRTAQNGTRFVIQHAIYVTALSHMSATSAKNMHSATTTDFANVKTAGIPQLTVQLSIKITATLPVLHVMAQESMIVWTVSITHNATTAENVSATKTGVMETAPITLALVTIAVRMDVPDQLPSIVVIAPATSP
jgi:hypothetical protein